MATVLVSGAGGICGIGAIRTLCETTDHRIVAVDMDPTAAGLYEADLSFVVPKATDELWPKEMARTIDKADVDAVILTLDAELRRITALRNAVDDVPFVCPRDSVVELSVDKYRMAKEFQAADLPTPLTWLGTNPERIDESAFPVLLKPRYGQGNASFEQWHSREELARRIDGHELSPRELVIQQFVSGTEYTTSVVGTRDGRLLEIVPKQAIGNEQRVTRAAKPVVESCRAIHDELRPQGPLNVQHIIANDGTPHVIEMNPRFSASSALTAAAGVNEYELLVRDALGESVHNPEGFETDYRQVRYTDQFCRPDHEMIE
jgi:carbamoyl-phosphate synthase large subunit